MPINSMIPRRMILAFLGAAFVAGCAATQQAKVDQDPELQAFIEELRRGAHRDANAREHIAPSNETPHPDSLDETAFLIPKTGLDIADPQTRLAAVRLMRRSANEGVALNPAAAKTLAPLLVRLESLEAWRARAELANAEKAARVSAAQ